VSTPPLTPPGPPPDGRYTSADELQAWSQIKGIQTADDWYLATNIIPRAEAWLDAFGPFKTSDPDVCPNLALAANMLSEYIFVSTQPQALAAAIGGFKMEQIGDYSYTLYDVIQANGFGPWFDLLNGVGNVIAPCQVDPVAQSMDGVLHGSEGWIFTPQPTVNLESYTPVIYDFDPSFEVQTIKGYLNTGYWHWPWSAALPR